MFDVTDSIFHGFASVYITYILVYRDISIIYLPLPCFHDFTIIFINLSFVLRLLGFADMCKICAKLALW